MFGIAYRHDKMDIPHFRILAGSVILLLFVAIAITINRKGNSKDSLHVVTIISTGDISLANEINTEAIQVRRQFDWPFEAVGPILQSADITIANLESPLIPNCVKPAEHIYILCGNSGFIPSLKKAGITVANIANNHAVDFGVRNTHEEMRLLDKEGILVSGISEFTTKNINGTTVSFLGFNDIPYNDIPATQEKGSETLITQASDENKMLTQIKEAKAKSDIVVVSYHWGKEYTDKITDRQRYLGHAAVKAGADLVLGNHPHWIQPTETYKGKLIVYSHGSLIFSQGNFKAILQNTEKTRIGLLGKYIFSGKKMVSAEFMKVSIGSDNIPRLQ